MKSILKLVSLLILSGISYSCHYSQNQPANSGPNQVGWKAVYKHDKNGNPVSGSIDSLIAGIRNGYDLRVGWGVKVEREDTVITIEHIAEPLFLTILQKSEVSIVIDAHPLLESYWRIEAQQFREGGHIWQCVMNTTGTFNARVYNRSTGELVRDLPQQHRMTWFLQYPDDSMPNAEPLFE